MYSSYNERLFLFKIVGELLVEEKVDDDCIAGVDETIDFAYTANVETQTECSMVDVSTQTEVFNKHVETSTATLRSRNTRSKYTQFNSRKESSTKSMQFPTPVKNRQMR